MTEKQLPDLVKVSLKEAVTLVLSGKWFLTSLEIIDLLDEETRAGVDMVTFTTLPSGMAAVVETLTANKTEAYVVLVNIGQYRTTIPYPENLEVATYQLCADINNARLTNLNRLRDYLSSMDTNTVSEETNVEEPSVKEPKDLFTLGTEGTIYSSILYDGNGLVEGWCYQGSDNLLTYVCHSGSSKHQISFKYVDSDKLDSKVYTFKVHYPERPYEYYATVAEFVYFCELLVKGIPEVSTLLPTSIDELFGWVVCRNTPPEALENIIGEITNGLDKRMALDLVDNGHGKSRVEEIVTTPEFKSLVKIREVGQVRSSLLYADPNELCFWDLENSLVSVHYTHWATDKQHYITFSHDGASEINVRIYEFTVQNPYISSEYYAVIAEFMYYCELLMVRVYGAKNFRISDEHLHFIYDWLLVNSVPLSNLLTVLYETITLFHTYGDNFTGVPIQKELVLHILQQWNKFLTGDEVINPVTTIDDSTKNLSFFKKPSTEETDSEEKPDPIGFKTTLSFRSSVHANDNKELVWNYKPLGKNVYYFESTLSTIGKDAVIKITRDDDEVVEYDSEYTFSVCDLKRSHHYYAVLAEFVEFCRYKAAVYLRTDCEEIPQTIANSTLNWLLILNHNSEDLVNFINEVVRYILTKITSSGLEVEKADIALMVDPVLDNLLKDTLGADIQWECPGNLLEYVVTLRYKNVLKKVFVKFPKTLPKGGYCKYDVVQAIVHVLYAAEMSGISVVHLKRKPLTKVLRLVLKNGMNILNTVGDVKQTQKYFEKVNKKSTDEENIIG